MPKYIEQVIWTIALTLLFFMDVSSSGTSLCLFRYMGLNFCPGCGLGHAVHYALHFNLMRSVQSHVLGPIITMAIIIHIFKPFFKKTNIKLT